MSAAEFQRYLKVAVPGYARAHIRAGDVDPKKALAKARAEYAELLPKGERTRGHYLYILNSGGGSIGTVWFEVHRRHGKKKAYLFDIQIDRKHRGKGFGRQALKALEDKVQELGARSLSLHVFGENLVARALYQSSGYEIRHLNMTKVFA
jgi:ribosomal protein S18 acetylase RimI-like enzyme